MAAIGGLTLGNATHGETAPFGSVASRRVNDARATFGITRGPGADGPTIPKANRWGAGASRTRDEGLAKYNDSSFNTVQQRLGHRNNLRRFASSFELPGLPARLSQIPPSSSTPALVGPGRYSPPAEAMCGGLTRGQVERFRPSAMFAARTGGKWAGTGGTWDGSWDDGR